MGDSPLLARLPSVIDDFHEVLQVADADPSGELLDIMNRYLPTCVVNGSFTVTSGGDAFQRNSRDPATVALFCRMTNVRRLFHLSDSMVFPGRGSSVVTDVPYPSRIFGLSRMLGERAVCELFPHTTVVRLGWLYGPEMPETPPMIAWHQRSGERSSALIYSDMYGSPTFLGDAAVVLGGALNVEYSRPFEEAVWGRQGPSYEHLAPAVTQSWFDYLVPEFPEIVPVTVRTKYAKNSSAFGHRNAGLVPTVGWEVPEGGLSRFVEEMGRMPPTSPTVSYAAI